jgi:hypothetical protein
MDVPKVFEELDSLVKPSQAQQEDLSVAKAFKLNVERFLQQARPHEKLSWPHVFNQRMLKTHTILSNEKYNQYVDAMKWYIENSEGPITKTQRVCMYILLKV